MTLNTLLSASAIALALGAPAAHAAPAEIIDQIVADLSAQGFVRIEIDIERDGTLDVDAYGGGREGDFYFDAAGNLLESDIDENEAFGASYAGGEPSTASSGSGGSGWTVASNDDSSDWSGGGSDNSWEASDDDDDDDYDDSYDDYDDNYDEGDDYDDDGYDDDDD